ncbi:hypothetical protein [Deinococcus aluminii]|uniref:Multidrug transporter n=1 Tax=Deinococcus aluminii TaxID=1656885 RepID=A0ABP9XDI1_9DEIO
MDYSPETPTLTSQIPAASATPSYSRAGWMLFDERRLIRGFTLMTTFVVVVGLLSSLSMFYMPHVFGRDFVAHLMDLNGETNFSATYNTFLLLVPTIIMALIARAKHAAGAPHARSWRTLSWIFAYLTLDESAALHERLVSPVHRLLHTDGFLHYAWVIPYGIATLLILLAFLRFLRDLPARTRNQIVLAGVMYVGGALGMELFQGKTDTVIGDHNVLTEVLIFIEESLEMFGLVVLISALLHYARQYMPGARVQVGLTDAPEQR